MTFRTLHNLTWIPLALIGLSAVGLGLGWLFAPEPWLLDRAANEALLQTTFAKLFRADINRYLPDYLTLSYRFFGWWVFSIGLLLMAYILVTRLGTSLARKVIHGVLFILLGGVVYIEQTFIPDSPFVWLTWAVCVFWVLSVWASIQLKKGDYPK